MTEILGIRALSQRVLAVAVKGSCDDWTAYVDAVEGKNHVEESVVVADKGTKLSQEIAEILFPSIAKEYEWRR